ncbi:MAG: hypothetical protein AMXMBFR53_07150 [Gemmatimonadota bacterium]
MRTLPIVARAALVAGILFTVSTCGGGEPTGPDTPPAPVAGSLALVSGDGQSGAVGAALGAPLVVNVKSTTGTAMSGQAVTWSVVAGGGTVSQSSRPSGTDGNASVTWTLGGTVGAQSVTATAASFTVTFTATAAPGPVAQVVVTPSTSTLEALEATVALTAQVKDAFGNTAVGAVTWSTSDAAVVTVDAQGVAKAVANGAADVVATSGSLTGKAALTVAQKATQVRVTPENPSVAKDNTAQLSATAEDENGFAVAGAAFAWTSSDATVATVDSTGLVTGVAEGTASVVAAAGAAADTVIVTVTAAAFKPTEDTQVGGTVNVGEIDIPAGVTVTLTDDAVINATGDVTIAGTLEGDCRALAVSAGGSLTLTGSVTTACSDTLATGGAVTLRAAGDVTLTGVTITSGDSVVVSNAAPQGAPGPARAPGADGVIPSCTFENSYFNLGDRSRVAGVTSPKGTDGLPGRSIAVACAGDMVMKGGFLLAGRGGVGGVGESMAPGVKGIGGRGGAGGDIRLTAGGKITFRRGFEARPVELRPGRGGDGGGGRALSDDPVAEGGVGGRGGLPFVAAAGGIVVEVPGAVELRFAHAGAGGWAAAGGSEGAHATATTPAEAGKDATALGGKGGTLGLEGETTELIGTLFVGAVEGAGSIAVFAEEARAGLGGDATAAGGGGGDGSREFPDGARAGAARGTGGEGGDVTLRDTRSGLWLGNAGQGGDVTFGSETGPYGWGGRGWSRCTVGMVGPGGAGGAGGDAVGAGGQPGSKGGVPAPSQPYYFLVRWGNGYHGGDGTTPGKGGAPGTLTVAGATQGAGTGPSFQAGNDGSPCAYAIEPAVSVTSDANGHAQYIALGPSQLTVTLGANNAITISGNGNWVTLTGTVDASGNFTATGSGTVAGYSNVPVSFTGTLDLDENGVVRGIKSGTLTMDSTNSNLPANSGGQRNPAVYSVTGSKIG